MTDRSVRVRRPRPWPIAAGAFALFLAVLALLAYQLRAGRDPALGAAAAPRPAVVAAAPPRHIVVKRRIIVTRVVTELRDDGEPAEDGPVQVISVPVQSSPALPAAPVPVAPAPAPAAPAPLTTSAS